jgi:hypothetical protein
MLKAPAEYQPDRRTDTSRAIAYAKAHAAVYAKDITKLVIQAAKQVSPWWCVGLRGVLAEDLSVEARLLLKVVTKSERLLSAIVTSGNRLTVGLNYRAIRNDINITVLPIVVIEQENCLLAVVLKGTRRSRGKFGLVLKCNSRRKTMVLFLLQLDFSANLNRANTIGDGAILLLMIERRPIEVQPESSQWSVSKQCVQRLLITGWVPRIRIIARLYLKDTLALDGGTIGDRRSCRVEVYVLCQGADRQQRKDTELPNDSNRW